MEIVPLRSWQDPQGDVLAVYSERDCSIYFGCWIEFGEPADFICQLSFQGAAVVRSYRREHLPYPTPTHAPSSFILRILDSDLLKEHEAYRKKFYPNACLDPSQYSHFVIIGHDIYHEIIALSFSENTIPAAEITDQRLLALYRST
jgi:hypothetical protein